MGRAHPALGANRLGPQHRGQLRRPCPEGAQLRIVDWPENTQMVAQTRGGACIPDDGKDRAARKPRTGLP
eukprot:7726751-Lingulodinium_polyedra.AAC.1